MTNIVAADTAWTWIRAGLERVQREPARWLGMSLVYVVIAIAVSWLIPFALIYGFLLTLLTPIVIAGALIAARANAAPAPADARAWLRAFTVDALRELFQVFKREDHSFAIILISIVTLGLAVLVAIPKLLITSSIGVLNIVVAFVMYAPLAMALFYLVPLTLFGHRHVIPAVAESFRTCVANYKVLAIFVAPFLLVDILIMAAFGWSHALGYTLVATLGLFSLPVFVIGLFASYRTFFEAPAASSARTNSAVAR